MRPMQPAQVPPLPPSYQSLEDANHLRMLAIGHYVLGAITALFSCFPLIHITMGAMMVSGKFPGGGKSAALPPDVQWMGWIFVIGGGCFVLFGWTLAVSMFLAGRWLSARKNLTFCFVIACIECINMPLGTILGVFTIVTLNRPSVRALFTAGPQENNFSHH